MTLGHQNLYLHLRELRALRKSYSAERGRLPSSLADYAWGGHADEFLREFLECSSVTVMDVSDYEGADTIHDMNQAVPAEWHGRFDAIIDCGSLEHIFNVPVAFANLANMLSVGGTLFITTPANNLLGHGFYQFSPELMYRVFSSENGFAVRSLTVREAAFPSVELTRSRKPYSVVDPQDVRKRVGLMSKRPVVMHVEAVKSANAKMFATSPQQSDYAAAWTGASAQPGPTRQTLRQALNRLPRGIAAQIRGRRQKRAYSLRNAEFYERTF